jgi:transcriptional regulator with XRE-family HTH domain
VPELAERLGQLAGKADLDQGDLARVLGTSTRTIARWLSEQSEPRHEARERLLEFLAVLERLGEVLRPSPAHDWLFSPNPLLDYEKPADLLQRREYRRVLAAIAAMGEGVFV